MNKDEIDRRLALVLEKTRRRKAEKERLSKDENLAMEKAALAAAEDLPKILQQIESEQGSCAHSEYTKIVVHFEAMGFDKSVFWAYYKAYEKALRAFLPSAFEIHGESCLSPSGALAIQWK